jgi:predicted dehydrogenase
MDKPITLAVIGAGTRGTALARKAAALGARIGAVAEPDAGRREGFAAEFQVPRAYAAWEQLVQDGPPCQAAILATLDNQHTGPALACLERGWHLLLEKPMADTLEDCTAIASAQERTGAVLAVCHTLRHLPVYTTMKQWVDEGRIGRPVHLEHMEAIGHVRYAHNYVRGRWGREAANTFLLLHKCCHDLDLIAWLLGSPCRQVASFGSLQFFRPEHAPAGSAPRCLACGLAERCVHSALRLYVEGDLEGWPARDVCSEHTREAHLEAIRTGPYGACAWRAGNDVVDHQTVLMAFEGGATATCAMTGYSATNGRRTRLQGTEGELFHDEASGWMTLQRFDGAEPLRFACPPSQAYHPEDEAIVGDWLRAIDDPGNALVAVDAQEALRTHAIVFAAERSRREGRTVAL